MASGFQKLLTGLVLLISTAAVQATTVQGLYIAELLVPEQQAQPAQAYMQQGLQQVLVKVSGSAAVINRPVIVDALQQPRDMLQQFSYQSTQTPIAAGDGREVLGQRLIIEFDPVQVDQLLERAGAAVIGYARPEVLVWLVAERNAGGRDFLAPEGEIYSQLNSLAQQRALPMVAPLLDLADQQALTVSDIWGFFEAPIRNASARYQPDAILVGRLIQSSGGGWQTQWRLLGNAEIRTIEPAGTLNQQLQQVVGGVADQVLGGLSNVGFRYQESGVQLEVANVDSTADFARLVTYLRELPPVESARVSKVHLDRVTFRIQLQGGEQAFDQAVRLNPRMAATPRLNADGADAGLVYRWQE